MRFLDLQGGGGSSIKGRAAPPPLFKSGCSVYRRPGVTVVVENSCGSGYTPSRFSGLLRRRPSMEVFSDILSTFLKLHRDLKTSTAMAITKVHGLCGANHTFP
ncbi:unnamed protein product [Brassica oleracea]|uniref:Uncharacterized protein n=1 Tax=Brassica oleracea TaxID=3712 RepID=A0A3P6DXS4_BRAOL|nr:unnamed protein product [Brassica oleracea]